MPQVSQVTNICFQSEEAHFLSVLSLRPSQVISQTTTYKRLLLTIKAGDDDIITALQRKGEEARTAEQSPSVSAEDQVCVCVCVLFQPVLLFVLLLSLRICDFQKEKAELQEELRRRKRCREESTWIPGKTHTHTH